MEDGAFDRLTRSLAGGISRRRALRAGLVGGWLALRHGETGARDDREDGVDIEIV